jgi:hypothetical protein
MTLTRAHIVERLFAKNLFAKGESAQIVETLFELIMQSLQDVEGVIKNVSSVRYKLIHSAKRFDDLQFFFFGVHSGAFR